MGYKGNSHTGNSRQVPADVEAMGFALFQRFLIKTSNVLIPSFRYTLFSPEDCLRAVFLETQPTAANP